ncbi:glycerol-3-phosphate responsive antiterminator [Caldifermentibacillus hisashii]|uniref:glycerol-3-phosphate responsive antiterminator n=1 Tax=Caldifermentibacillus hisashii TaxID=996558 RepID=UPI0037C0869F
MGEFHIIPSIRRIKYLPYALSLNHKYIYLSDIHLGNLQGFVKLCHDAKKRVIVNMDLVGGLEPNTIGIKLLKQLYKVDIVIGRGSSKVNMAKATGLDTIQRIVLEDSIALETSEKYINDTKSDFIELRPGIYGLKYLHELKKIRNVPFILSGFINSEQAIFEAKNVGFFGITTSEQSLWNVKTK